MSLIANLLKEQRESKAKEKAEKWPLKSFTELFGDPNDFRHLQQCNALVESLKSSDCCFALEALFDSPLHYHERFVNFIRFSRLQDFYDLDSTIIGYAYVQEALVAAQFERMKSKMVENGIEMSIIY